ncbi:hypothetical protein MBM_08554 [Drepanopeziza brunnea f. sp. 'multigermtubi' MB_m1]|uniref:Uncharacterized protein n=1 Tax=Marssonina brunnea f. sp. multigermtubi (strain MB_m1) TaxID=1072389 RepID=K1WJU4_MARBU|nr:uncharacterized protein MBM_08554 [Drepanopeziza brunnea f. sp. 'multigermtubi' MB_m1]EKD13111.1 hypothetical protein MBM_08554 [Drepanopeziza brunnea f. sp. 'multigermtubi' MB_m1]
MIHIPGRSFDRVQGIPRALRRQSTTDGEDPNSGSHATTVLPNLAYNLTWIPAGTVTGGPQKYFVSVLVSFSGIIQLASTLHSQYFISSTKIVVNVAGKFPITSSVELDTGWTSVFASPRSDEEMSDRFLGSRLRLAANWVASIGVTQVRNLASLTPRAGQLPRPRCPDQRPRVGTARSSTQNAMSGHGLQTVCFLPPASAPVVEIAVGKTCQNTLSIELSISSTSRSELSGCSFDREDRRGRSRCDDGPERFRGCAYRILRLHQNQMFQIAMQVIADS